MYIGSQKVTYLSCTFYKKHKNDVPHYLSFKFFVFIMMMTTKLLTVVLLHCCFIPFMDTNKMLTWPYLKCLESRITDSGDATRRNPPQ